MARTNLPGNILKSLNTRLLGNLKSGVDTNIDLMQGQANLAEQGVQRYADISAQDFLSDIEAVNTGDPTQDLLARNQLVQQMKADPGLIDMGKVNVGLRNIRKQAPLDYLKGQEAQKVFKTQHDIDWDTKHMRDLPNQFLADGSVNPAFQTSLESNIAEARRNNIAIPQEKALYRSIFDNDPFTLSADTTTTLENLSKGGAKKFTKSAQAGVINKIADNMAKKYPGITDRSVFKTRAGTLLANSKYGQNFTLGIADEATDTIDTLAIERMQSDISNAAQNYGKGTGAVLEQNNKVYRDSVNALITFMNKNNIGSDHPNAKNLQAPILRALQRDGLTLDDVVKGNTSWLAELNSGAIKVSTAQSIKGAIRKHYQTMYPELTDGIFDQHYDKLKKDSGSGISAAITQGAVNASAKADVIAIDMKNKREFYTRANRAANAMEYEGVEAHITRSLMEQLKSDYKDEEFDPDTGRQLQESVRRTKNIYDYAIGRNLPESGPERDAYNLALKRTMLNSVTWTTKVTAGTAFNIMSADFGMVGAPGDINPASWQSFPNKVDLYNRFKENIIPANALRKAEKNERKLKEGSKSLITATNDAIRSIKSQLATKKAKKDKTAETLLKPVETQNKMMSVQNLDTMNKLANQD